MHAVSIHRAATWPGSLVDARRGGMDRALDRLPRYSR